MTDAGDAADPPWGIPAPGFRLPDGTRVGRVRLKVADLARSLAYYQGVLGLRVLVHGEGGGEGTGAHASLAAEGSDTPLIELLERPGAAPAPRGGGPGLYHFAILLPDRRFLGAFVRHLGKLEERAGASDHLVSEALYLQDPDGLGIEVYADRPRSAWRHRDRQLLMATEPLDLEDLVRAAGDAPWNGMPAGTTMGHVHLHVGDLERAAAFYHDALGLDKMVWGYPGALFLSAGGYHHHLGVNTWAASSKPPGDGDAGLLEWELLVPSADDVDRAASSLESAGHPVERPEGGARVRDPWGTSLGIRPEAGAR